MSKKYGSKLGNGQTYSGICWKCKKTKPLETPNSMCSGCWEIYNSKHESPEEVLQLAGVTTGRLTAMAPNPQQIPLPKKEVAPKEWYKIPEGSTVKLVMLGEVPKQVEVEKLTYAKIEELVVMVTSEEASKLIKLRDDALRYLHNVLPKTVNGVCFILDNALFDFHGTFLGRVHGTLLEAAEIALPPLPTKMTPHMPTNPYSMGARVQFDTETMPVNIVSELDNKWVPEVFKTSRCSVCGESCHHLTLVNGICPNCGQVYMTVKSKIEASRPRGLPPPPAPPASVKTPTPVRESRRKIEF